MKSLWRVLFQIVLWNEIVKEKYLINKTVIDWIRNTNKKGSNASSIRRGLINYFPSMGNSLAWKIGNTNQVKIGEDSFIGGERFYNLSAATTLHLRILGI